MKRLTLDELQAQRLVDGLLAGPERATFEARLAKEPALAELVERLRATRAWFAGPSPAARVPPGFARRVAQLHRLGRIEAEGLVRLLRRLALAASLLLLLGLGSLAWLHTVRGGKVLQGDDLEYRYQELLRQAHSRGTSPPQEPAPASRPQRPRGEGR